jgi:hypothetical protein
MKFMEYFTPFELAARLALLGFNEECLREWARDARKRIIKPQGCWMHTNFDDYELRGAGDDNNSHVDGVLDKWERSKDLTFTFMYRNVAAPMNIQVLDWFREKYEIDVMQVRKSTGSGVTYLCDPVGPGIGDIQLPECKTPNEAQLQCIKHLVGILKPLEGCFDSEDAKDVEYAEDPEPCEVGPND